MFVINRKKKEEELEEAYDRYHALKDEMYPIGRRLGWYDENGSSEPLYRLTDKNTPQEEKDAAYDKTDLNDVFDFIDLQVERNKTAKKIVRLEKTLGIPLSESKA